MAKKSIPGLYKRGEVWHIDKQIAGYGRLRCSTGTSNYSEAQTYLIYQLEQIRKQVVYGARSCPTFRQAATRYLNEYSDQPSAWHTATYLSQLVDYIGDIPVNEIKHSSFERYITERQKTVSNRTINIALQRAVRVLNICARKWRDERNRPWLDSVPLIEMLDEKKTARTPYPLDWKEQEILFSELAPHLRAMALFKVNTGCREQEVCKLQWDWEIPVAELGISVFLIPADFGGRFESSGVKNGEDRLVVLNSIARTIISNQRGQHPIWVFPYDEGPMARMNASGWRAARRRAAIKWERQYKKPAAAGFSTVRVHDLKHTFGRRLRAAGSHLEDRQVLLGHTNGSITTHYSAADLSKLLTEVEKLVHSAEEAPVVTLLRRRGDR
ncbi:tyrosine-type recombinase/integrase [Alcaligenes endophyticus]|uniref:Tyrosine-type recombinase/integrase n=1 Tax=Alcaligenes endophyticus TaxID=1929088 RepID=A0ABT8EJ27_9BURK|nr:tyrosine-type recombinase/integrase [Alcaligenes endophyticus]MCX5592477.1 tyrosine-type recombinase/integrase [Alcaligenes endophyticus]MDN4121202.1 tyrosine-type recombinase/integrase [Alcaligenes endophyticus]